MLGANPLRKLRVTFLVLVLLFVGVGALVARVRTTSWNHDLWMVVYPVNGDRDPATARYIRGLTPETFGPIAEFMREEAAAYGLGLRQPVRVWVAPEVGEAPPEPPRAGGPVAVAWWSLRLRYWAWRVDTFDESLTPDVRMFVVYFNPDTHSRLAHSVGLQKGLIGVVNAFSSPSMSGSNNVVIAHEMLHTVGATDKYDSATNAPLHPAGYAEPGKDPLHPQEFAEIMAGRVPLEPGRSRIPEGLHEVVIGRATARELNWVD